MSTNVAPVATLRVTRLIKAPRDRVFAAWTAPEEIVKWFGPETCRVTAAEVDLREGGEYHFRVKARNSDTGETVGEMDLRGVYREVKPPGRLVYTWNWQGDAELEFGETLVTVEFLDKEGFTEVQITHDRFPNGEVRDKHGYGWNGSLDKLEKRFAGGCAETAPQLGGVCWNELLAVDPAKAGEFYSGLFGWKTEAMPGGMNYTIFKSDGKGVAGLMARPHPEAPPHWLAYVMVESVDDSAAKAEKLGAKLCLPPTDIPTVGRIAVFQDPEGAPLGLFQPPKG